MAGIATVGAATGGAVQESGISGGSILGEVPTGARVVDLRTAGKGAGPGGATVVVGTAVDGVTNVFVM